MPYSSALPFVLSALIPRLLALRTPNVPFPSSCAPTCDGSEILHDTSFLGEGESAKPSSRAIALLILNCNEATTTTTTHAAMIPETSTLKLTTATLPPVLDRLLSLSSFVMCADGGANRLYDMSGGGLKPDAIKGDLDSIRPEVQCHYEKLGVEILKDVSVDTNDLEKCLWHLKEVVEVSMPEPRFETVCVYSGLGGRFDQMMSSISALFKFLGEFTNILLIDEGRSMLAARCCDLHCTSAPVS